MPIRAAAYFLPAHFSTGARGRELPALRALGEQIAARRGPGFTAQRIAALRASLAAWRPHVVRSGAGVDA